MQGLGLTNGKKLAESQNCRAESDGQLNCSKTILQLLLLFFRYG